MSDFDSDDDLGDHGTTRGGGTPVKVIVKSNGVAVGDLKVTAKAGGESISEMTNAEGVASFTLAAGHYTISATGPEGSATKSVNVVESTTTELVALTLEPAAS